MSGKACKILCIVFFITTGQIRRHNICGLNCYQLSRSCKMSWLSGLTGKAEDFLNKLDQSAAQALTKTEEEGLLNTSLPVTSDRHSPPSSLSTRHLQQAGSQSVPAKTSRTGGDFSSYGVSTPVRQSSKLQTSGTPKTVKPKTTETTPKQAPPESNISQDVTSKKKIDTDAALFDFLNSPEPLETKKTESSETKKKTTPASSARHSRQSSTSSVVSNKGGKVIQESDTPVSTSGSSIVHIESLPSGSDPGDRSPTELDGTTDVAALADAMMEQSPSNSVHSNQEVEPHGELEQKVSSLELENKLLKNEVSSLNQEMATVLQRSKDAQSEVEQMRRKMDNYQKTQSQSDQLVRELQSRESDLMEALQAKDSQLGVLRIRLEEADKQMESKQKSISELEEERGRILRDHSDSTGVHSQALDSVQAKLSEVEGALRREQDALKQVQQEASDRQSRLEQEQRSLADALTAADRRATEEKSKASDLANQLKAAKQSADSARQELADYKEKAARILQSKERLIASLREGSGASGESMGVSNLEYDSVKQERDMFKEELQQYKMTVENLRMELLDMETQLQHDSDTANEQIRSLEDNVSSEKQRREEAEQELLKQKQELQYNIEELRKTKMTYQTCIKDREAEIEKLRNQIMTKSMSSSTENELEARVKTLTESLIQKQTTLETLSTQKNSLALQLERMEQQYKDIQSSSLRTNTTVVNVHDDEEVRQRYPGFMRETPTDHEVTKKMKRAANVIDKFSIRLGVFLRRYPIARVFILMYMVLLHIWVMIVLLTYQPEMHSHNPGSPVQPEPPGPGQ
ncbi:golgin subfamily A member 5-like isoform X2 [Saccostrea echinata]|uniref:golgin subfamily A member 5-like isoform X2 n=1 Tax=Saccostrea echinata TaxID=191078 RepID=UPI002A8251F6|nr:golgin subfamily A member 5-like isoform X2 [Saccostrea echinata]